ncbi:MGH1-like glycoside hydrolase domain-containing protein [Bacillus sp. 3255]|uniref:MGH1-like glycoside hydrolase domain-containing protein n=1 Tax=Bacillus sp. 3255 TaxID=2817904 RepID=UPI00285F33E2|nr:trehalase family glycosidase [Bacillus sp. 3255]MDR6881275.1 hypothetical protein [Bacillus sp. 3255]
MKQLAGTHDLISLDDWGPYTKSYMGISHVADSSKGIRFDLSVIPGFYRRKIDIPNVMWESGYHPWEAANDLSYYSHRHELEWKDQVYCDISFSKIDDHARLMCCEAVNQTNSEQNLVLHLMGSLHMPQVKPHGDRLQPYQAVAASGSRWVDALDYSELRFALPRHDDGLVYDALLRGEIRGQGFVSGSGVGHGFGKDAGDRIEFRMPTVVCEGGVLKLRYRMAEGTCSYWRLEGAAEARFELTGTGEFAFAELVLGRMSEEAGIVIVSEGGAEIELDGFFIGDAEAVAQSDVKPEAWSPVPTITQGPVDESILLRYEALDHAYGIRWFSDDYEVREIYAGELDRYMRYIVHHHVHKVFHGPGEGHFTNVFLRPIRLAAGERVKLYAVVANGSESALTRLLSDERFNEAALEELKSEAHAKAFAPQATAAGEPYSFGQRLMAATMLTNIVYPVYMKKSYIKHHTPGRWWDCLYTWDSGFVGIGLAELDPERAVECLNTYVTEPGDTQAAFVHHGSPVPVQHYLFLELWNKTQNREWLAYFYPRLKQYYKFISGFAESSMTRRLSSNLITTWDYFYNSGGWDDYPPQVHVHRQALAAVTAPVSNTAHCIRIAKILCMMAEELGGAKSEIEPYLEEIKMFEDAIQQHAWDAESGYFGYVQHDADGSPQGILRHESGENFNCGLDGAYPLVAGIATQEQEALLIERLFDGDRMWTEIGLSTVDRSAAYYREDGYWNGAVWMPHQWFYWKTMLDLGYPELARKIAMTGLACWRKETELTYNCYEHFIVSTGRGAGWHHFGGLSSPVLVWFNAYYKPGTITAGLDTWVTSVAFREQFTDCEIKLRNGRQNGGHRRHCMIVVMNPSFQYAATWNGAMAEAAEVTPGVYEVLVPAGEHGSLHLKTI